MSPSDSTKIPLRFPTKGAAEAHSNTMNELIKEYPSGWNVDFWNETPVAWITWESDNVGT